MIFLLHCLLMFWYFTEQNHVFSHYPSALNINIDTLIGQHAFISSTSSETWRCVFQHFAYHSLQDRECVSSPLRCQSDPHTNTGHCCCDIGVACSNPPRHRKADTDLQIWAEAHSKQEKQSFGWICSPEGGLPSNFFPACFLLMLESSALHGESERERQGHW